MYNNRPHPLLQQVPLTVSPFVTLPTATTLSYNYKNMPSTLPPSSLAIGATAPSDEAGGQPSKPKYVTSPSGMAYHPDDIINACQDLRAHLAKMQEDAERDLREFEERVKARELAEKRRVAPGWLDSEARLLEPERKSTPDVGGPGSSASPGVSEMATDQGAELDRAFGGLSMK